MWHCACQLAAQHRQTKSQPCSARRVLSQCDAWREAGNGTLPAECRPPEAVDGAPLPDAQKADIWAAGAMLYRMLTGAVMNRSRSACGSIEVTQPASRLFRIHTPRGLEGLHDADEWAVGVMHLPHAGGRA